MHACLSHQITNIMVNRRYSWYDLMALNDWLIIDDRLGLCSK